LSALSELHIVYITGDANNDIVSPKDREAAIDNGIPSTIVDTIASMSRQQFLLLIADAIGQKTRCLKRLHLDAHPKHGGEETLLQMFSHTLEHLKLSVACGKAKGMQQRYALITDIIESMPNLKKLDIGFHGRNRANLRIISTSLEDIDVGCTSMVKEIRCPLLKKLKMIVHESHRFQVSSVLAHCPLLEELDLQYVQANRNRFDSEHFTLAFPDRLCRNIDSQLLDLSQTIEGAMPRLKKLTKKLVLQYSHLETAIVPL